MKALIITADNCDDSELLYPYFRLLEAGLEVDIASFEKGIVRCKKYYSTEANFKVDDVNYMEYDCLVLPGGTAPEKLRQNDFVIEIVQSFFKRNLPVCSICHGQQILISAKVLEGKCATCYPGIKDDLINAGAIYADKPVVVDGKLVTSRRPEDLPYFMREFINILN